jgi:hypothetical protein
MNNNNEDQGQRNAATLMRILARRRETRVPKLVARDTATSAALRFSRASWPSSRSGSPTAAE